MFTFIEYGDTTPRKLNTLFRDVKKGQETVISSTTDETTCHKGVTGRHVYVSLFPQMARTTFSDSKTVTSNDLEIGPVWLTLFVKRMKTLADEYTWLYRSFSFPPQCLTDQSVRGIDRDKKVNRFTVRYVMLQEDLSGAFDV